MTNGDIRNLFGIAITIIYARSLQYSGATTNKICQAVAQGFDLSTTDGDAIYAYFNTESHPDTSAVFFSTPYTTYEEEVYSIIEAYLPSADENQVDILSITAHAMIFAYSINACINITEFQKIMGNVLAAVSATVLEYQYFSYVNKLFVTPFSSYTTLTNLLDNDYSQVITSLGYDPKTILAPLTNYNWYDTSNLFKGPDLQIMKDVENQYYYLSGKMIFESAFGSIDECIEDEATINTWSGNATFTYYRNTPCRQGDSYIGPPNLINFNRIFNDGPSSSGYFSTGLSGFYIQNDKNVLLKESYLSNSRTLYTYSGSQLCDNVAVDANGEYSLLNGDYLNAPYSFECDEPYQRLHIGDNKVRYICAPKSCICTLSNVTGFKYVALSLSDDSNTSDWQFRQTNPISDNSRILHRALNIEDNPYWATDIGGTLYPYIKDASPPYTEYWTIGYPVLNGKNTLPELAFFQTFDSPTFGDSPSITIYPSLATANGSVGDDTESDRIFSIGSRFIFSGEGGLPLKFNESISSNLSGFDTITQKFFGMGTAFSGKYDVKVVQEENAGFFYSGFTVSQDGKYVNSNTLADSFLESTIGNTYSIIKYISGYRRLSDGATFGLTNFFAKNASGDLYTYSYISQDDVPMATVSQDNWDYFAPTPSALEDQSIYERIYSEQEPENHLPRFYDGPFSSETRKFLYPNALAADSIYGGKNIGIPKRIRFKVDIREEVVKEIYGKYTIYPDGTITESPEIVNVIRSDVEGNRTQNPKMYNMFIPNDIEESFDYDFNNWGSEHVINTYKSIPTMVDKNWAPALFSGEQYYIPSGRNSDEYNVGVKTSDLFSMGLKAQSRGYQQHVKYGQTGSYEVSYSPRILTDALFHAFEFTSLSGVLSYALPIFNLENNRMEVNNGLIDAFPDINNNQGLQYTSYNGLTSGFDSGRDPLFLEIIGGRRGSIISENEGGYHSKEIIGDRWMGMVYESFGIQTTPCYDGGLSNYIYRYPYSDGKLVLFNTDASGTDIWINGMSFSPYKKIRDKRPLTENMSYNYSIDNYVGNLSVWTSGEFINFNLGQYFPLRNRTGAPSDNQWYYQSGLRIGPFDRDVEIGLTDGETIVAYSEFYINGQQLSHWFYEASNCERDWIQYIGIGQFIKPGEPFYSNPRRNGYTILSVIPSGTQANINILSNINNGIEGDPAMYYIGMPSGAIVTLKTHVPLDANGFEEVLYSGEQGRLESFGYVNNGIPYKYRIEHDSFENMAGVKEFINYGYSGKLYSKPNEIEFKALATTDSFGNEVYPSGVNTETYWRSYAIKHEQKVYFSGYREGSRISFDIYDVQLEFDILPYQSYDLVSPSGNCSLSGEMNYYAQADNSIFTEGIYLKNSTLNDDFVDTYNPSYVSNVLSRLPSGFFVFPETLSGSGHAPVLQAPSVMKQREYISGISEGQKYSYFYRFADNNYNKLLWPALSDLETLNPGDTIESIPPGDGDTFTNSTMMFSACQGQKLPNGLANPIINKSYSVNNIFQMYDSVATDAIINSGKCITSGRGVSVELSQKASLVGALVPRGTALGLIINGLV